MQDLEKRLTEVHEHLDHLRFLDKEKSKSFLELRNQVDLLMSAIDGGGDSAPAIWPNAAGHNQTLFARGRSNSSGGVGARRSPNASLSAAARNAILANLSVANNVDMAVPNIYDFLPHLLHQTDGLTPAVRIASSRLRRHVHTVIGIPTIRRPKTSYLVTTLRSLIDNLSGAEQQQVLLVVLIADEHGVTEFASEQILLLQAEFPDALQQGLLEIVVPSPNFYPADLSKYRRKQLCWKIM